MTIPYDAMQVIELDAAWEAHEQARRDADKFQRETAWFRKLRIRDEPLLRAFERISGLVHEWENGRAHDDVFEDIKAQVVAARRERADIEQKQKEAT